MGRQTDTPLIGTWPCSILRTDKRLLSLHLSFKIMPGSQEERTGSKVGYSKDKLEIMRMKQNSQDGLEFMFTSFTSKPQTLSYGKSHETKHMHAQVDKGTEKPVTAPPTSTR